MDYSPAEIAACKELLDHPPEDRDELRLYVEKLLRVPCPAEPFHETSASPLDMLESMWNGDASTVTIASRGSYKTLDTAAGEYLVAHYQNLPIIHFAAGEDQVRTAIAYFAAFQDLPWWRDVVDHSLSEIVFKSGGRIMPRVLSKKNVRSKHVPRVVYDESDEMDPIFYKESLHICDSLEIGGKFVRGVTHHISTHNRARGIVDTLRNEAELSGRRVMQWDYKDVAQRCEEERHGGGRATVWVNRALLQRRTTAPPKPDGWERVTVHSKCPACPLVATCRGDLAHANGTRAIDDLIQKIEDPMMTPDDWHSQQENLRPSTRGLSVPEWDESAQVREVVFDPMLGYGLGVDFSGGEHNAVIVAAQKIPVGWPMLKADGSRVERNAIKNRIHVFDELVVPGGQFNPAMCETWTRDYVPKYGAPAFVVADPSQLGNARHAPLGDKGRSVYMDKADNDHRRGYSNVRRLCIPVGDDPHPALLIHPRCERLRLEMGTVRKKLNSDGTYSDEVDKRDDDAMDAARYLLLHLVTKGSMGPVEALRAEGAIRMGGLW